MSTERKSKRWQLQDAKNRFSELVTSAQHDGPQIVTRRGADTAVVLSYEDYKKLSRPRNRRGLATILIDAPKLPGGLRADRDGDLGRELELE